MPRSWSTETSFSNRDVVLEHAPDFLEREPKVLEGQDAVQTW